MFDAMLLAVSMQVPSADLVKPPPVKPPPDYTMHTSPVENICYQFIANVYPGASAEAIAGIRREFERVMAEAEKACMKQ